jgi:adenylate cyclase
VQGATTLAFLGERERAKQWALRAMTIDPDDAVDLYNLGCALARMGEPDQAIDALESCYTRMAPEMVNWMKADSDLTSLHGLPRYKALVAKAEARLSSAQAGEATSPAS